MQFEFNYLFFSDLAVLHQVLSPRIRAFHMCLVGLKDHVDAVYDVTIAYSNTGEKTGGEKIQRITAPSLTGKDCRVESRPVFPPKIF